MATFSQWLRQNAEHYLVEAAQRDLSRRHLGRAGPLETDRGPHAFFWRRVFVPVYRQLPWALRQRVTQGMPGSHRRPWRRPPRARRR